MGAWQHGLCGCFDNCGICIIAYLAPCVSVGQAAEKVGESCCMCGFCFLMPIGNCVTLLTVRGKVREVRGIDGSCIGDLLLYWFCPLCTIVQTVAEAQYIVAAMAQPEMERY